MEKNGCILIADITGYTGYLSSSELEHAQGTLTDLLELLIDHTRPPLLISRLEGDAVISYGLEDDLVSGQTLLEEIEETYVAFRRAIELMVLNNSCQCNACANVPSLDLKFLLHHGTFAVQHLGHHEELLGSDVNFVHRLLKNTVTEATGIRAYLLCTDAAVRAMAMDGAAARMVRHVEQVPDFGETTVWVQDMHPVFAAREGQEHVMLADDEILASYETELSMPPELVWDSVNQSERRNLLMGSHRFEVAGRQDGRVAPGSTYQCYHGNRLVPQVVLEWQPFERVLLDQVLPVPGRPVHLLMELRLEPTEGGTRLIQRLARLRGPAMKRAMVRGMIAMRGARWQRELEEFGDGIEASWTRQEGGPGQDPRLPPALVQEEAAGALAANRTSR